MDVSVPCTSLDYGCENLSAASTFTSPDKLSMYYNSIDLLNWSTSTSLIDEITENAITTEDQSMNYTAVSGAVLQLQLYDYVIPPLGVIILLLNLAVVISSGLMLRRGAQPRTTYLFLGNVAMADMITSAAVLFGELYSSEHRNDAMCILQIVILPTVCVEWTFLYCLLPLQTFASHAIVT